tara:strand:- start:488 stop:598 length:111 start_codon:yes stop_codon:yes gene_type:complete
MLLDSKHSLISDAKVYLVYENIVIYAVKYLCWRVEK